VYRASEEQIDPAEEPPDPSIWAELFHIYVLCPKKGDAVGKFEIRGVGETVGLGEGEEDGFCDDGEREGGLEGVPVEGECEGDLDGLL